MAAASAQHRRGGLAGVGISASDGLQVTGVAIPMCSPATQRTTRPQPSCHSAGDRMQVWRHIAG
jgi:hypothetical protein